MNFHCLFEQSGTFKNVFKSYGHRSFDYDILNDYGETDFKIDLFKEIDTEFENIVNVDREYHKTIFSDMKPDKDFIIAFFPCTYFTDTNEVQFKMYFGQKEPVKTEANVKRILKRIDDRAHHFSIWNKFCFICQKREIPTIIENPAVGNKSYLKLYSAWQPSWVESDRTFFGDYFKKPTYFFAINFEMKERFMMFDKEYKTKIIRNERGKTRSEITPLYADNFYKRFLERFIENVSATANDKTSCQ